MITEDLSKGQLISGTGQKYKFTPKVYLNTVKFIMKKFRLPIRQAKSQLNFYLVTGLTWKGGKLVDIHEPDLKSTNARLNNIVNLDYDWNELWNS